MKPSPPKSFIIIVDNDGDPTEVLSSKYDPDEVLDLVDYYNESVGFGPYAAWRYDNGKFQRIEHQSHEVEQKQNVPITKAVIPAVAVSHSNQDTIDDLTKKVYERDAAYSEWSKKLLSSSNVVEEHIMYPGTRIGVHTVVDLLQKGVPRHEIVAAYPDLTDADVEFTKIYVAKIRGGA